MTAKQISTTGGLEALAAGGKKRQLPSLVACLRKIVKMKRCSWVVGLVLVWGCQDEQGEKKSLTANALEKPRGKAASDVVSMAHGIVIERVSENSAPGKAGIQSGDILLSWKRLPSPPANPELTEGQLRSPFDLHDLRLEQVPRGAVEISGQRSGIDHIWKVERGNWRGVKIRPGWSGEHLKLYRRGQQQIVDGNHEEGANAWQMLADRLGHEGKDRQRLWMLFKLARLWAGTGREQPQAAESVERILEILKAETVHNLEAAYAQQELGLEFEISGEPNRAQELYNRALLIRQQYAPESLRMAYSLNDLGIVTRVRGDLDQAYDFYTRALRIQEHLAPGSLEVASSLANLGTVAYSRGDLDQAHEFLTHARQIQEQFGPESFAVADSLNNLGLVAKARGDLDQAHNFYTRALRIQEHLAPESLQVAGSLGNLGIVAIQRGDLNQAWKFLTRALRIQEQFGPESLAVADSLNNLGGLARDQGDLDQAQDFFTRALQIREEFAPESLQTANILKNIGLIANDRKNSEEARDFFTRALRIREQLAPKSLAVADSLANLGDAALDRGDLEEAEELYSALRIQERLAPHSFITAYILNRLAHLMLAQSNSDQAIAYSLKALGVLEQQIRNLGGSYGVQADFRAQKRNLYQDTLNILLNEGQLTKAFHVLERFRARTFLTMLSERDIAFTADLPEALDRERRRFAVRHDRTLKRLAELSAHKDAEEVATIRQELEVMDRERGEIEERIRRASPRLAALQYPQPLTAKAAQEVLDPGTLLVSYVVGEESTSIFALSREKPLEVKTISVGEATLRKKIEQLRELIPEAIPDIQLGQGRTQSLQDFSRDLYKLLLEPVAERIDKSGRLLILPDGPLHTLPFAALIRGDGDGGENDQYLVEWKPLHIALSVTAYAELKKARPPAHGSGGVPARLAAFGDPSYPAGTGLDFEWQPLPYSRREVEGIAELFPRDHTQVFLGPEALEERVKNLSPGIRILHLAAHAYTNDRLPLSSFVALTIPEDLPEGHDNGLLHAWEIVEQVRIDADLVVLSGCLTGMGQELRGEGLIGLTRAFQYAGARSIMSTLWSVSDQATAELMVRFYRHLLSGMPKDEALRAAQLELLRESIVSVDENGQSQEFAHASAPFYWAGVQLYGDWQ